MMAVMSLSLPLILVAAEIFEIRPSLDLIGNTHNPYPLLNI